MQYSKCLSPVLSVILLASCGTYRHYQSTPNPALFYNKGDFSLSGDLGTSGTSLKGSVAVSDHIGIMGMYHGGLASYESHEGELGIGYYNSNGKNAHLIAAGLAFGSNAGYSDEERTTKRYEGDFRKSFIQWNYGVRNQKLIFGIHGNITMILKGIYLDYDGRKLNDTDSPIHSNYTIIEPGFVAGLGSKNIKFDIGYTFPITARLENPLSSETDARTFPLTVSVGLRYLFSKQDQDD